MAIRTVKTMFPFNGLPKNLVFTFDDEIDHRIAALLRAGYVKDVTESAPTITLEMPSIESGEEIGDVGGEGEDQPSDGDGGGEPAVPAASEHDVPGDEGAGPKVAKGRKPRTDLPADG